MACTHAISASAILALGLNATPVAATIIGAMGATINQGGPGSGSITSTFDQSGLSANYVSGETDFDSFVAATTHSYVFTGNEWFSDLYTTEATVTYDLGSLQKVDSLALWNDEAAGIGLLDLSYSTDGTTFWDLETGLTPTDNPQSQDYLADIFGFGVTSMQYLRLSMSDCPQPDSFYPSCAIGEVAFRIAPVPVPAALPLVLTGIGGLMVWKRRRARAIAAF